MSETIIEAPDKTEVESNVEQPEVKEEVAVADPPEGSEEQPVEEAESQDEPKVKIGEKEYTPSQVKKWEEDYANDSKWKDKNKRESEELNARRKQVADLELLKPLLEQRPEILKSLFTPAPQRDITKELEAHYLQQPDPISYPAESARWNLQRDMLIAEQVAQRTRAEAYKSAEETSYRSHNSQIYEGAKEVYKGKVDDGEFEAMTQWIVANIMPRNNRYDKSHYDVAFRTLYPDKFVTETKLDDTKKRVAPIVKSRMSAGDDGTRKTERQTTPEDDEDADFSSAVKARSPKFKSMKE